MKQPSPVPTSGEASAADAASATAEDTKSALLRSSPRAVYTDSVAERIRDH